MWKLPTRPAQVLGAACGIVCLTVALAAWRSSEEGDRVAAVRVSAAQLRAEARDVPDEAGRQLFSAVYFGTGELGQALCAACRPGRQDATVASQANTLSIIASREPTYFAGLAEAITQGSPLQVRSAVSRALSLGDSVSGLVSRGSFVAGIIYYCSQCADAGLDYPLVLNDAKQHNSLATDIMARHLLQLLH